MAKLETGIRSALLADAGIVALVADRVRPIIIGQTEERPFLTYKVTDRKTDACLDGSIADYRKVEFEIGIFADDYETVMTLSDLAREQLDQYGETISGVEFAPCMFEDETDVEEVVPEGEESPVYLRVQTYRALYKLV